ncbi:peptidoglycan bridge formation glycyltransferase FemA/FemB family protein [Patescibacteria group bacterium]|nr:peptidoglycan bridge formation glycyltransferase FemA/FemB family protein [Patescibacteria group bacterium]
MNIRSAEINEKEKWNRFVLTNETGSLFQSWEWTDFISAQREKAWRLIVEENNEWLAVIFLYKGFLKFKQPFLYAPRGPVSADSIDNDLKEKIFSKLMNYIDNVAREENALYFQLDPLTGNVRWLEIFDRFGFVKSARDAQPRHTLILDIRKSEEELLNQMHQKTRYNIRLAQKKGVEIMVDNNRFKEFHELLKKTESRKNITLYEQDYFEKLLKYPFAKLYLAKFEGKIIAANIMVEFGNVTTYLFGATDYEFRSLMAPHLLQWQAMKDAKERGIYFYDFGGAAPKEAKGHEENWFGFTKFKMGFSPAAEITEYVGSFEKVYAPVKLGIYRMLKKISNR